MKETTLNLSRYEDDRVKSLGFVRPITNSELQQLGCTRSYTFEYVEQLESENINKNFAYGACWHVLLEKILLRVKESDNLSSLEEIKEYIREDAMREIVEEYFLDQPVQNYYQEEIDEIKKSILDRMYHSIDGWYFNWKSEIHPHYKVIDVEKILFSQISKGDSPFTREVSLAEEIFEDKIVYRELYSGEQREYEKTGNLSEKNPKSNSISIIKKKIPFYKIGKADAILLHRTSNTIWILDHKTTKSVQSYLSKTQFSLQLIGYCSLLRDMIRNGEYSEYNNPVIGGIIWDICSSDISSSKIPKPLKSKKLSKSQSKITPYWLYEKAIKDNDLNIEEYSEFLNYLRDNKSKFFDTKLEFVSDNQMDRIKAEDYFFADKLHMTKVMIQSIDFEDQFDWDLKSPRFTMCSFFGSCKYSNICFSNTFPNDIYNLSRQQKLSWITANNMR